MLPYALALRMFDIPRSKASKWRSGGHLHHQLALGSPGVQSMIPREAVIELGMMQAATSVGFEPADVKSLTENWLRLLANGDAALDPIWAFSGGAVISGSVMRWADFRPAQAFVPNGAEFRPDITVRIINLGEIIERVRIWEKYISESKA